MSMGNAALEHSVYSGVLAQSPVGFQDSGSLMQLQSQMMSKFAASNKGITLDSRFLFESRPGQQDKDCILPLCSSKDETSFPSLGYIPEELPYEFVHQGQPL